MLSNQMDVDRSPTRVNLRRLGFTSISQNNLCNEISPHAESLKKLATNYKNTLRGRLEFEKYKASLKDKKPFDPRFRRERNRNQKPASSTQSDQKLPQHHHEMQSKVRSSPLVKRNSNEPATPRGLVKKVQDFHDHTEFKEFKEEHKIDQCKITAKQQNEVFNKQQSNSVYVTADVLTNVEEQLPAEHVKKTDSEMIALPKNVNSFCQTDKTDNHKKPRDKSPEIIPIESAGDKVFKKLYNCEVFKSPYLNNEKLFKKYAKLLEVNELKRSKSSMSFSNLQYPNNIGDCDGSPKSKPPALCRFETLRTEVEDTGLEDKHFASESGSVTEPMKGVFNGMFYAFGSFIGLVLVTAVAWILTNDVIWRWVNGDRQVPIQRTNTFFTVISYLGGAVIFSLNIVVNAIYKIFFMPRSSVFNAYTNDPARDASWFS